MAEQHDPAEIITASQIAARSGINILEFLLGEEKADGELRQIAADLAKVMGSVLAWQGALAVGDADLLRALGAWLRLE